MSIDFWLLSAQSGVMWLLNLALLGIKLFALFDAVLRPAEAFVAADKQTKTMWTVVLGLAVAANLLIATPISLINLIFTVLALVYLADALPALRQVTRRR